MGQAVIGTADRSMVVEHMVEPERVDKADGHWLARNFLILNSSLIGQDF